MKVVAGTLLCAHKYARRDREAYLAKKQMDVALNSSPPHTHTHTHTHSTHTHTNMHIYVKEHECNIIFPFMHTYTHTHAHTRTHTHTDTHAETHAETYMPKVPSITLHKSNVNMGEA